MKRVSQQCCLKTSKCLQLRFYGGKHTSEPAEELPVFRKPKSGRGQGYGVRQVHRPRFTEASTPLLFKQSRKQDRGSLIHYCNLLGADTPVLPDVPKELTLAEQLEATEKLPRRTFQVELESDPRLMNNEEWMEAFQGYALQAIRGTDLDVDLFESTERVEQELVYELPQSLSHNLVVDFSEKDQDYAEKLYESVLLGNFLECDKIQTEEPIVSFTPRKSDAYYSVVMLCPDYPYTLLNDHHNMVHWAQVNIKGGKGETVIPYLPPLPTEYSGVFRYVFVLMEQSGKIDDVSALTEELQSRIPQELVEDRRELAQELSSDYIPPALEQPTSLDWRRSFSMDEIYHQFQTTQNIQGLCFFRTEHDFSVTQYCQDQNIEEMIYVPPDVETRVEKKEQKKIHAYQSSGVWA